MDFVLLSGTETTHLRIYTPGLVLCGDNVTPDIMNEAVTVVLMTYLAQP